MRKYFILFLALLAFSCSKAKLETVDDVCTKMDDINFMKYCYDNFDVNKDGKVSMEEANAVKSIVCTNQEVTSVNGIEYFPNLEKLDLSENNIPSLDFSLFTKLESLNINKNQFNTLALSQCLNLTQLRCERNHISSLDLSKCINLKRLECGNNQMTSLVLPIGITQLWCMDNKLSELELSKFVDIEQLYCGGNLISEVDVSQTKWSPNNLVSKKGERSYPESVVYCVFQHNDVRVFCNKSQFDALPPYYAPLVVGTSIIFICGNEEKVVPLL